MKTFEIKYVNWEGQTRMGTIDVKDDECEDDAIFAAHKEFYDGISYVIECNQIYK